jgi:hypothetical protein
MANNALWSSYLKAHLCGSSPSIYDEEQGENVLNKTYHFSTEPWSENSKNK